MSMSVPFSPGAIVSPALLVSLVSPPWLLAIVALQTGSELVEQLGIASEEIFRGDRLPVLHFPENPN